MMNEKVNTAMNTQIKEELESAYIYYSMAAYFHNKGLDGMAQWMKMLLNNGKLGEYGESLGR